VLGPTEEMLETSEETGEFAHNIKVAVGLEYK